MAWFYDMRSVMHVNKKRFPRVLSRDLYWENKTYKLERSIPTGLSWYTNMAAVSLFCNSNMAAVTNSIKLTIGNNCLFLNRNPFWSWSRYCERQQHSLVSKCSYFDNLQVTGSTEPVARVTILGHNIVCIHTWQAKKLCTFILRQDLKWAWLSWWSFCFPFCW